MNDQKVVKVLVADWLEPSNLKLLSVERDSLVSAILAYGEQVRREQREADAQIVESFAVDIHMEATDGAEIAAAIRANDQVTKPKGENHAG